MLQLINKQLQESSNWKITVEGIFEASMMAASSRFVQNMAFLYL